MPPTTRSRAEGRRTGVLVRISDADPDDEAGVERQERDCRELAARLGWSVTEVFVENDTSAYKRRKVALPDGSSALRVVRPEFRRLLGDLASGALDALIAYDLDRVVRDPRDLEDLIDVVEQNGIPTRAVTGSLDLSNDAGITMARVMVAVANKSSRDTARRVRRKHEELAEQGKYHGGGLRCYGYADDRHTVIEAEAKVVREIARRILDGHSSRAIAQDLTKRGVPTKLGSKRADGELKGWSNRSVHSVVTNGRVAGLRTFRGEIVGKATWPAILDRDTWDRVRLTLEERANGSTNRLIRWLTGVLLCGQCGDTLCGWGGPHGPRYWCATERRIGGCGKTAIQAAQVEDTAERLIVAYLKRPDVVADLAEATSAKSVAAARDEAKADQEQLKELASMWAKKMITMPEYLAARKEIEQRLSRWQGVLRQAVPGTLRAVLNADSIETGWGKLDPAGRRDVARVVFPHGIEIVPPTIRFAFDPKRLNVLRHPRGPRDE